VDKKRVTHPAHSIFRYRSDHGYQSLTPQTCPRGIDREGNVMFCDEMWNGVSVFGCQSDIDRFKDLCIEEPDEQDEDQETYVTFDNILLIARAEDPKLAASLAKSAGFETWNFRAGKNELAGTYHFAFDTSPRFPYQVFKYLAKIFPNISFDCRCIADNDDSMGYGWFNTPHGGEDFSDCYPVPDDYWENSIGYRSDPISHKNYEALVAQVQRSAYEASMSV
jgi:hypothetical protein